MTYCSKILGNLLNKLASQLVLQKFSKKIFGAHIACLSILIPKLGYWEELRRMVVAISYDQNTKTGQNKSTVVLFYDSLCFVHWQFTLKINNFKFQVRLFDLIEVDLCSANYAVSRNSSKIPSKS